MWRQVEEPTSEVFQCLRSTLVAMRREFIAAHDGFWQQFRRMELPSVCGEGFSVHCASDHPWGDEAVMGQTRDERLCAPRAEGRSHFQAACHSSCALASGPDWT